MSHVTATVRSPKTGSHIAKVRDYLASGRSLTHVYAFVNFGTMRLASCIEELRNKYGYGDRIVTTIKDNPETGAKYASYTMKPELAAGKRVEVVSIEASELAVGAKGYFAVGDRGVIVPAPFFLVRRRVRFDDVRGNSLHARGREWYVMPADLKVIG
jgi:hypothetical protein